jgi:hypothetical protein
LLDRRSRSDSWKAWTSSSDAPANSEAMYVSGLNPRLINAELSNLEDPPRLLCKRIQYKLLMRGSFTLSKKLESVVLLFTLSSAGKGSKFRLCGTPLVEYRRFIKDSTFDLSFGRTRGGGGRGCEDPSAMP